MAIFNRLFLSKEFQSILEVLAEAEKKFDCLNYPTFSQVKKHIEDSIYPYKKELTEQVRNGRPPRNVIYFLMVNITGDLAESGEYHIHRGVLNPVRGADLLLIHDAAIDELVKIGSVDSDKAAAQKSDLRECIKDVG